MRSRVANEGGKGTLRRRRICGKGQVRRCQSTGAGKDLPSASVEAYYLRLLSFSVFLRRRREREKITRTAVPFLRASVKRECTEYIYIYMCMLYASESILNAASVGGSVAEEMREGTVLY